VPKKGLCIHALDVLGNGRRLVVAPPLVYFPADAEAFRGPACGQEKLQTGFSKHKLCVPVELVSLDYVLCCHSGNEPIECHRPNARLPFFSCPTIHFSNHNNSILGTLIYEIWLIYIGLCFVAYLPAKICFGHILQLLLCIQNIKFHPN
jgi:hypothetical protein